VLILVQLFVSIRDRAKLADRTGRSLAGPHARMVDRLAAAALELRPAAAGPGHRRLLGHERGRSCDLATATPATPANYEPIEMPRNSPVGVILALFSVIAGFALIWHIWWLAIIGLIASP